MRINRNAFALFLAAGLLLAAAVPAEAQYREDLPSPGKPVQLPTPGIVEKPNARIPLELAFRRSDGAAATLGDCFNHGRPVILSLVYFSCPNLCGYNQNALSEAVKSGPRELKLGVDYDIVVVSIDPDDTPVEAAAKRKKYLALMERPESQAGFTYLTGTQESIKTLADAVGFNYYQNPANSSNGKFAHSTGIFICTPDGRLSQTILGITYGEDLLHYRLVQASSGKIGSGLLSFAVSCGACYFDPKSGHYKLNLLLVAGTGLLCIAFVGTFLALLWKGEAKRKKHSAGAPPAAPTA